jgi:hypothetical protein
LTKKLTLKALDKARKGTTNIAASGDGAGRRGRACGTNAQLPSTGLALGLENIKKHLWFVIGKGKTPNRIF